ncbi:FUSC family protein [Achromobacter seleniivolatilans]|uniref:FUSC family protein n=1 Tax=Achromobacter seleniivolatilans TaxID=3047478 RepID=A0ABY9M0X9_9BURK|nr:FUSC family protein [Achromobacter sp. R39]WMD20224.1 FUSC family protein [Achromobacter sp. R39]
MKSGADIGWLSLLAPFPGRAAMAWRIALVCALTAMVAMTYGIPESAISCYLVFFVMKPDAAESSLLAVALSVLVAIVVVVLLLLTNLTLTLPAMRIVALALSSLLLLFLASASKLGPLGGIIALVLAFGLTLLSYVPFGEAATRGILYAWLMATMPMALVLIVSVTVGRRPLDLLRSTVTERLDAIASYLESGGRAGRVRLRELLGEGQEESMKRWGLMRGLALARRDETRRLGLALQESYRMLFAALALRDSAQGDQPEPRAALAARTREVGQALAAGHLVPPVIEPPPGNPAATQAWRALSAMTADASAMPAPQPAEPFLSPDAFRNPDHIRYAAKTTAAALICYLIYSALDWQDIHTAMITCYVAALGSVAETTQKLMLRIIGCLIGAAMGVGAILFLIPHMSSVGSLMALVFVGAFVAAWVAVGSERVAYAGVQIALAFMMTVLQGFGPSIDMSIALDRVIGILLGNVVLYLVFSQLWPVSVGHRVREELGRALEGLARMARLGEGGRDEAVAQASAVAGRLAGIRRALGLATLEPRGLRLDSARLRGLIAVTQSVQALCMRLLIDPPGPNAELAARLEALARTVADEGSPVAAARHSAAPLAPAGSIEHLSQLIEGR